LSPGGRVVAQQAFDQIKFEVIRNALVEAVEEMGLTLRRSGYSTNIKTRSDFSCAFFDRQLRVVAQGFNQPNHLGSLVQLVPRAIGDYGAEAIHEGDAIITNDPYRRGGHLNDVTFITPVYHGDELFGYVANVAHHVDVGGGAPASVGAFQEVFQEGVIVPPVKLVDRGEIVPDIFALVLAQIRSKRETGGDFRAQVAANNTGVRRIRSLLDAYGTATVNSYIDELIDYTERRTRAGIAKLVRGEFEAEGFVDNDGFTDQRVRLVARLTIDDEGILFDFTGSDIQRRAPVNSTYAQTFSTCAYIMKCLIDPDIPANAGLYRTVRLIAPEGTVVNCEWPAPVVGGWETAGRLGDVMFRALSNAMPDRVPAGTKGMMCHAGFGGFKPGTREYYCFLESLAGGYGGRIASDGPDAVQIHGQNTENAPVEETELNYPVWITRYELVEDSEGPGRFRGGLGMRRDYEFRDAAATFTVLADRDRDGPWGLFGGSPGKPAEYILNPDRDHVRINSKSTIELEPGDVVSYRTCGGGGYGDPFERDPQLVLADVHAGKVRVDRARDVYRVVIDPERWVVDLDATSALRNGKADRDGETTQS
jgi:N-methylhydantoinase B